MIKNIFQTSNVPHKQLTYEMTDFCFESAWLDISYVMEDVYFDINSDHLLAVHTGLKDSNVDILEEGFKDFVNGAVEFFKKLINKVKEFMQKVFMYLNAYIGDFDKFIKRHSKELSNKYPNFDITGHKFTIDNNVPDLTIIQGMIDSYNSEITGISEMTKSDIVKKRGEAMNPNNLNKIRAKVLSVSSAITKEDYNGECKKKFRNGESDSVTIHVDHNELINIINGFETFKKSYNSAKKDRDKLISLLENIKSFFQKSASLQYNEGKQVIGTNNISVNGKGNAISKTGTNNVDYSTDKMILYNTYFNFKFAYSKEISAICVNAMNERVNALKEQLKQSKDIVRKSLSSSNKENGGDE